MGQGGGAPNTPKGLDYMAAVWRSGISIQRISEVTLPRTRLVLGWVTVLVPASHFCM